MWWWLLACGPADDKAPAGGDDTDVVDTDVADTDGDDTDRVDSDPDPDPDEDTAPIDTDETDETDPPVDTGPAPFQPDPTCDYLDLDLYVVDCGGAREFMRRWVPADGDPTCPAWYSITGDAWLDPATAIAQSGCEDDCVYTLFQAVMIVYCERRGEYLTWQAGGPGQDPASTAVCPDLLEVHTVAGDAWVYDFADYEASFPCP